MAFRNLAVSIIDKYEATVDAHGDVNSAIVLLASLQARLYGYLHTRVGFGVARSSMMGTCQSLWKRDEQQARYPRFSFLVLLWGIGKDILIPIIMISDDIAMIYEGVVRDALGGEEYFHAADDYRSLFEKCCSIDNQDSAYGRDELKAVQDPLIKALEKLGYGDLASNVKSIHEVNYATLSIIAYTLGKAIERSSRTSKTNEE